MLTAITRSPGQELAKCELKHLSRCPIDIARACAQHRVYQAALRAFGVKVIELPHDPVFPDGVFVEDTAVVLDEVAVAASLTPPSRRAEFGAIETALRPFRPVVRLVPGGFLEGGDVVRLGRCLYVGLSARTNELGLRALEALVRPFGYSVIPVKVGGCLHLKSACSALDEKTLLLNRQWVDKGAFSGLRLLDVPAREPGGANVLALPGTVFVSTAYPNTGDLIRAQGFAVVDLEVSELHKAEAGLTCMSLVFERTARKADNKT